MHRTESATAQVLEQALSRSDAWLIVVDETWTVVGWNRTAAEATGYARGDFTTLSELVELLVPDRGVREALTASFVEMDRSADAPRHIETSIVTRSETEHRIAWTLSFLRDAPDGPGTLAVAVGTDVTAWRRDESLFRRNESFHRFLLESLREGIWWVDSSVRTIYANRRVAEMLGVRAPELMDREATAYCPAIADVLNAWNTSTTRLHRADGSTPDVEIRGGPVRGPNGEHEGTLVTLVDLSDFDHVRREHDLLQRAVEHASEGVVITDVNGTIVYVNPACTEISGYSLEEAKGSNPRIFKSEEHDAAFYATLWETISGGKDWTGLVRNRRKDGVIYTEKESISPVEDDSGAIIGYIGVKRDVTDELERQEYAQASQKLQAIGTLAGGIAHDYNNILMAILGYANLAAVSVGPGTPAADHLKQIVQGAERARDLSDELLTFSRGTTTPGETSDLTAAVREAVRMLRATTPATVDIEVNVPDEQLPVRVARTQVVQIVMNLGLNAVAAIEPQETGRVTITTERRAGNATVIGGSNGDRVSVTVSDDGCGMTEETKARLFEPFFTTRPVGQGTGMGLPVVHGIVQSTEATIDIDSTPGEGSAFTVCFLLYEVPNVGDEARDEEPDPADIPGRGERLLVVDDESTLLEMLQASLESHGFQVKTYSDPDAALGAFERSPDDFDAVITDVTMPRMRGDHLAERMLQIRPLMPIVGYTGYSSRVDDAQARKAGMVCLMRKPFDPKDLAITIRSHLEARNGE